MNKAEQALVQEIFQLCHKYNVMIRTAESCTGGTLSSILTELPGSSNYFDRGVTTYSNQAKTDLLNICPNILEHYGAVSYETATLMAENLIKHKPNFLGIATTGILGPASDNTNKPIGLVYIALYYNYQTIVKKLLLSGDRNTVKEQVTLSALQCCLDHLKNEYLYSPPRT